MATRGKPNRRAEAVAIDWLSQRPTMQQVQAARDELGYHTFRDAVAAHDRAERGVIDGHTRASWSDQQQPLPFNDEDES